MTGLATATFPDGTLPDVDDVTRIAANLFSAGRDDGPPPLHVVPDPRRPPRLQQALRASPDKIPAFIEEPYGSSRPSRASSACHVCP